MLFHEPQFLVFLGGVVVVWLLMHRINSLSKIMLLSVSFVFYAAFGGHNCVLLGSVALITYVAGILLRGTRTHHPSRRVCVATLAILCNLGLLCFFKYHGFLSQTIGPHAWPRVFAGNLLLPVGMSFYVLQSVAYIVDVYRTTCPACRNPLDVALLVSFFPKVVIGPLVRPAEFLTQLAHYRPWRLANVAEALPLLSVGLFKKVCLADTLAMYVNPIFANPQGYSSWDGMMCLAAYSFQIYYDFSGCIDMVRAIALLLGYTLPVNFNLPYCSTSVTDFWRRWHITLSLWLRDYFFLPVAYRLAAWLHRPRYLGLRADSLVYVLASFVTMVVCGIWHGAGWTFVVWGAYHGLWLVIERFLYPRSTRPNYRLAWPAAVVRCCVTFVIITAGWLVFRADSLQQVGQFIALLRTAGGPLTLPLPCALILIMSACYTLLRLVLRYIPASLPDAPAIQFTLGLVRGIGAVVLLVFSLIFACNSTAPYIYFQF